MLSMQREYILKKKKMYPSSNQTLQISCTKVNATNLQIRSSVPASHDEDSPMGLLDLISYQFTRENSVISST